MQAQDSAITRVIGYARVSTAEQEDSGAGLDAQAQTLTIAEAQRGWEIIDLVRESGSGKDLDRETLYAALSRLAAGEADALAVAKLDRLTRSLIDFAMLLRWFEEAGKSLIALDFDLDTSTPTGELMAHIIIAVAQWERRAIGQRTSEALGALRAKGQRTNAGNVTDDSWLTDLIGAFRSEGLSMQAIADELNSRKIPTIRGGQEWRKSAVQCALGYKRPPTRAKTIVLPEPRV